MDVPDTRMGKWRLTRGEIKAAQEACDKWRIALILSIFCGLLGILFTILAWRRLWQARRTFGSPLPLAMLLICWPGLQFLLSFSSDVLPHLVVLLLVPANFIGVFYLKLAIFQDWQRGIGNKDTGAGIRIWERVMLFFCFPFAGMVTVAGMFELSEGMEMTFAFDVAICKPHEAVELVIALIYFVVFAIASLVYEFQLMGKFNRVWSDAYREVFSAQRKAHALAVNDEETHDGA